MSQEESQCLTFHILNATGDICQCWRDEIAAEQISYDIQSDTPYFWGLASRNYKLASINTSCLLKKMCIGKRRVQRIGDCYTTFYHVDNMVLEAVGQVRSLSGRITIHISRVDGTELEFSSH